MIVAAPNSNRWVTQKQRTVTAKSLQILDGIDQVRPSEQKRRGAPRMTPLKSALGILAVMLVSGAWPQQTPMSEDIAGRLVEPGPVVNPSNTAEFYVPLQEKEPYHGVRVERDVKYGPADRNLLDVFMPEAASAPRPVLIFAHGGALVAGDRLRPGTPFFDNIMLWAVKNGFVGVNMTYRLAPQAKWPAGAEDIGSAVQWVASNIGGPGGDPSRVYLTGHSAGPVYAARYGSHPRLSK